MIFPGTKFYTNAQDQMTMVNRQVIITMPAPRSNITVQVVCCFRFRAIGGSLPCDQQLSYVLSRLRGRSVVLLYQMYVMIVVLSANTARPQHIH